MLAISNLLWQLFGALWRPFRAWPNVALFIFAAVTAVLALVVWKYASNQKGITRAKDRIKAHFFAMVLFQDSLIVLLASIAKTFGAIFLYLGRQMLPLIVMMIPILPMLVQIDYLYSYWPVMADPSGADRAASVQVTAVVDPTVDLFDTPAELIAPDGVRVVTKAVRLPFPQTPPSHWEHSPFIGEMMRQRRLRAELPPPEVRWEIRGEKPGVYELTVRIGDASATKRVVVGDPQDRDRLFQVAPVRHDGNFGDSFGYPGEAKLAAPFKQIRVDYPRRDGWWWWVVIYLIETLIVAFALKKPFKVDF